MCRENRSSIINFLKTTLYKVVFLHSYVTYILKNVTYIFTYVKYILNKVNYMLQFNWKGCLKS